MNTNQETRNNNNTSSSTDCSNKKQMSRDRRRKTNGIGHERRMNTKQETGDRKQQQHHHHPASSDDDCSNNKINNHGAQPMPRSSFSSPPTNLDEAVDIVLGVIQVQAGPQATGGPQLAMQRLRAVVPGTNRYTFLEASTSKRGRQGSHHDYIHIT